MIDEARAYHAARRAFTVLIDGGDGPDAHAALAHLDLEELRAVAVGYAVSLAGVVAHLGIDHDVVAAEADRQESAIAADEVERGLAELRDDTPGTHQP